MSMGMTNLSLYKPCSDVCYLRLDFESFTLLGPSDTNEVSGGACLRDTFKVTVSNIYSLLPGPNVVKKFTSVIYGYS